VVGIPRVEISSIPAGPTRDINEAGPVTLSRTSHLAVAVPLGLAALLGAYHLGAKSLWWDEAFSVWLARLDWPVLWRSIRTAEANMMLYYLLLHFWIRLGMSEAVVRSLSTLAAVTCIVPFYFLGVRVLGARPALLASVLLASNAFFIRYAQEARAYSLELLLTVSSSLLFLRAIDRPTYWRWAAYAVVSALAVYAHFFAAWVLVVQFLAAMIVPDRPGLRARFAWAQAAVAAELVPLAIFASQRYGALAWVQRPTMGTVVKFGKELTGYGGTAVTVLYLLLCLAFFLRNRWLPNDEQRTLRWQRDFVVLWLTVPILGTLTISWFAQPIFYGRFLFLLVAPLALAAAGGIQVLPVRWVQLGTVVTLFALALGGLRNWYKWIRKEDWRGAAAYVLYHAVPGDSIAFRPSGARWPSEYYLARLRPDGIPLVPSFPAVPWGALEPDDFLLIERFDTWWNEHATSREHLWVMERSLPRMGSSGAVDQTAATAPPDPGPGYCIQQMKSFYWVRVELYGSAPCKALRSTSVNKSFRD
jgi:mannosyltransferase